MRGWVYDSSVACLYNSQVGYNMTMYRHTRRIYFELGLYGGRLCIDETSPRVRTQKKYELLRD